MAEVDLDAQQRVWVARSAVDRRTIWDSGLHMLPFETARFVTEISEAAHVRSTRPLCWALFSRVLWRTNAFRAAATCLVGAHARRRSMSRARSPRAVGLNRPCSEVLNRASDRSGDHRPTRQPSAQRSRHKSPRRCSAVGKFACSHPPCVCSWSAVCNEAAQEVVRPSTSAGLARGLQPQGRTPPCLAAGGVRSLSS